MAGTFDLVAPTSHAPLSSLQSNCRRLSHPEASLSANLSDNSTFASVIEDRPRPEVAQEDIDRLIQQGGRFFGLDSCASHTFTNDLSLLFDHITLSNPIPLTVATRGSQSFITMVGKMKLANRSGSITLNNVYYSPAANCTLLSAETLRLGGGKLHISDHGTASVHFPNGFGFRSYSINRRWQVPVLFRTSPLPFVIVPPAPKINTVSTATPLAITAFDASIKNSDALMWHRRLGHISLKRIIRMCALGSLPGLPDKLTNKDFVCEDCLVSKSKRNRGSRLSEDSTLKPMDIIVSDVLGPFIEGFNGVKYLVVFRDLASTYSEGFLLKAKSEVCLNFKRYIERMERLTGKKLKRFRTDGGGEFTSKAFLAWLQDKGIEHQHSMPYEPEQNGAAERLHRTVGEMARTALVASGLPTKFWGFAYLWGYFTHNRMINSLTGDKTPIELMFDKKPLLDRLRAFGEVAFVHKPDVYQTGKTD